MTAQLIEFPETPDLREILAMLERCQECPTLEELQRIYTILKNWERMWNIATGNMILDWPPSAEQSEMVQRIMSVGYRMMRRQLREDGYSEADVMSMLPVLPWDEAKQ